MKARDSKGPSSDGDGDGAPLLAVAHALRAEGFDASEDGTGRGTPLVFQSKASPSNSMNPDVVAPTMDKGKSDGLAIAFDTTQITSKANRSVPKPGDPSHPLAAGAHAPAIAFGVTIHGTDKTARATSYTDVAGALRARMPGGQENSSTTAVHQGWAVRRLTPTECERLQGFPDNYTAISYRNRPAADGPRYKALGNSMAVNVMRIIGERIAMVDAA